MWRLNLVTLNGKREMYAIYTDRIIAMAVFSYMVMFMRSEHHLVEFKLGAGGPPFIGKQVDMLSFEDLLKARQGMTEEEEADDAGRDDHESG